MKRYKNLGITFIFSVLILKYERVFTIFVLKVKNGFTFKNFVIKSEV